MSSAAEAELGALFIYCKLAVPSRKTLEELGHPQPKTPMQMDNSTANGLLNNKIIPKPTKSINMKFHWMRCRDAQGQFRFYCRPGTQNWGDYWMKNHPATHHWVFRKNYGKGVLDLEFQDNGRGFTEIGYVPKSRVIFKKNR